MAIDDAEPRAPTAAVRLPIVAGAVDESERTFDHPIYQTLLHTPGLSVATASIDELLTWGYAHSLWVFPMATSCCGIELMAAAASRVDLDRMGTIVRASPRQADVMVVAGTITVKMAPRVKKLWDQMPEPKWCIAMGSCAISGDFYRDLYAVIPGIDTVIPVDVYAPGCPPNPEALMASLIRLQEKVTLQRQGKFVAREPNPALLHITNPSIARFSDPSRDPALNGLQTDGALHATDGEVEAAGELERAGADGFGQDDGVGHDDGGINRETGRQGGSAGAAPQTNLPSGLPVSLSPCSIPESDDELAEAFADRGVAPPLVPVEQHHALARRLKALGYRQLVYIVASHWPAGRGRAGAVEGEVEHYEVAYGLRTVGAGTRLASWSVRVDAGHGLPSLVGLYAGADWQEREQQDLVGVAFAGHPDPRRLMMPDRWEGHPLRRDYPADKACPPWR